MTANFTGGAGGGSYTYAGDSQPADPVEGETWYDTGDNEAYVFDGAGWVKQTVTDHGEIGGVTAGQHRSDANIEATVHDPPTSTQSAGGSWSFRYPDSAPGSAVDGNNSTSTGNNSSWSKQFESVFPARKVRLRFDYLSSDSGTYIADHAGRQISSKVSGSDGDVYTLALDNWVCRFQVADDSDFGSRVWEVEVESMALPAHSHDI